MFADVNLPWSSATVLIVVIGAVVLLGVVLALRATRDE